MSNDSSFSTWQNQDIREALGKCETESPAEMKECVIEQLELPPVGVLGKPGVPGNNIVFPEGSAEDSTKVNHTSDGAE